MRFSLATRTLLASVFLAPIVTAPRQALALCQVNTKSACSIDGKAGTKICVGEGWGPCIATPACTSASGNGKVTPLYYVLAVLYAPPGSAASGNKSSNVVAYSSGSSVGTKASITSSLKSGYTVSFGGGAGAGGNGGNFGSSTDSSNMSTTDITQNTNLTISDPGPSNLDGLNHDYDQIWLWLSPTISLAASQTTSCAMKIVWSFGQSTGTAQYFYVGWLKNPPTIPMPANILTLLQSNKITSSEYPKLLAYDPLANGAAPTSPRYTDMDFSFPFEPPPQPSQNTDAVNFTINNSDTISDLNTITQTDTVGLSMAISAAVPLITGSPSDSLTWTTQTGSSQGTSNQAVLQIAGPSSAYTAPTDPLRFEAYKDNLYNTYAFVPIPNTATPTFTGTTGKALAGQLVAATGPGGVTYHTVTNAKGEYKFFEPGPTNVKIVASAP
jgi:hypothetical protein